MTALSASTMALTDRFEVVKEIGDGSFGSVVLAKVRSAGSSVARRGTLVAIKTMKKTFDSFQPCLELREVIFLKQLPIHPHLVPALDIFLDPTTKKLHIAMEYMDGNLYQLMKARDHRCLDGASVKSILFQILSGLEHIHAHGFFHRDIKPENILVSSSGVSTGDATAPFRRYSSLATPPASPPTYTVKIADFGLAREMHSRVPYTTYVSTRWYRAPEVLLRAGEYSAPVDIWAVGAMAVEVATLKPLFPGSNEVDQVWRVCEIMGSPGNWQNRSGRKIGGGEWKDGARLAQKLGFSFPRMTPQSIEQHYLPQSQWPASLSAFVTWCLMWDPKARPTSVQALAHEYFADAVDPLKPKASNSRSLRSRNSELSQPTKDAPVQAVPLQVTPNLHQKPSWFRKSFAGGNTTALQSPPASNSNQSDNRGQPKPQPVATTNSVKSEKRSTWHAPRQSNGAPIPILPTIRPVSPLSDTVTAQAAIRQSQDLGRYVENMTSSITFDMKKPTEERAGKKLGRQLSVNSNSQQQYTNPAHAAALSSLTGQSGSRSVASPGRKEGSNMFAHFRKRVRRLSGRNQAPVSPADDDVEAQAGCGMWSSNRSSMVVDQVSSPSSTGMPENDRHSHRDSGYQNFVAEVPSGVGLGNSSKHHSVVHRQQLASPPPSVVSSSNGVRKENGLVNMPQQQQQHVGGAGNNSTTAGPISSRTRRAVAKTTVNRYDVPDEEEELLDEAIISAARVARRLERLQQQQLAMSGEPAHIQQAARQTPERTVSPTAYPTPPSHKQISVASIFGHASQKGMDAIGKGRRRVGNRPADEEAGATKWPTPPYEENHWAPTAATVNVYTDSRR